MLNKNELGLPSAGKFELAILKISKKLNLSEVEVTSIVDGDGIRSRVDSEAIRELALSMKEVGILQPVVLIKNGDGKYKLVIGHRRVMAARFLGLRTVPAVVLDELNVESSLLQLVENIQREELHPFDEARAIIAIRQNTSLSDTAIAMKIGKSRTYVVKMASLSKLFPYVEKYPQLLDLPKRVLFAIAGAPEEEIEDRINKFLGSWRKKDEKYVGMFGNIKLELKLPKNLAPPPESTLELLADLVASFVGESREYEVIIRPRKK